MNILELDSYNLADAVKFHNRLNPRLWDSSEHLRPEVQSRLQEIAEYFQEFLGVPDLDVKDITISGSNAAYSYTRHSDIDLHLVVDMPADPVYQELFTAKKYEFNDTHNIKIGGAEVELYVQPSDQAHHSQGIYSIKNRDWVQVPQRKRARIDDACVRDKVSDLDARIHKAIKSRDIQAISSLWQKIKSMRQAGLEREGEFGCENVTFKLLRNKGCIEALKTALHQARDRELSLAELARPQQYVKYGFVDESPDGVDPTTKMFLEEPATESPDGVNPTTAMFLTETNPETIVDEFICHTAHRLGIKNMPRIFIHHNEDWSKANHSFGMYVPEKHELHVSLGNRHLLDILRTTAHELCHCAQHEQESLPHNAGITGSDWENEAHAVAGIIMRDFADAHPDYFKMAPVKESASGYIPKNKKEARDPRYSMALTVDIKPGQVGKEANKLALHTGRNGEPALLMKSANLQESLAAEFALFESQDLFEINMGSKNLRREAAKTGAIAGMEFEMIVPNVEGGSSDLDQEADYDYDQRCRSIQDAYDFFYDGDWNSRRSCDEMRDKMREDYIEWLDEKIASDWDSQGEEYIYQWVKENVDESEWNPEDKSDLERTEALEEYAANVHADPVSDQYQSAYEEFREENQESYDESDWLDDADLSHMSEIENAYSMSWPHWSDPQSGGEASIEDVASEFENAIGRDVRASGNYHSGSVIRPSPTQIRYVVEPDGSLEGDNPGDQGLEFVSPPLPIDEILSDLNKVKKWAKEYGCYTNDSTGLHINISVPNYSRQNLDFVKLALLMGDKYVLDAFGRSSNTYAKSAFDIVKRIVRDQPEEAAKLLDKMKGNLDQLATKAIHSGATSKYTSINVKDGHIEFRSPGGDWLDENFDQIENTLLRFTVAMSAALNPEAYRQEYLTKLYKLLTENNRDVDTIKYFSDYVAGKIPKAALRSFVKQAQLQRNIERGKTGDQKMWWKVYKDGQDSGRYGSTVEVVASSKKEAIDKAAQEWGLFSQEYKNRMDAEVVRPYEEQPDKPDAPQTGTGTYELFDRRTGEAVPDTEFSARNQSDVNTRLDDYINFGPHGIGTVDARLVFGARPVATGPNLNGRPSNPDGNYVIIDQARPTRPVYRYQAADSNDGLLVLQQWIRANPGETQWTFKHDPDQSLGQPRGDGAGADQGILSNSLRPTGPGPWEVYNRTTGNSTVNLIHDGRPITDRAQAQRLAMNLIAAGRHELYGVRTRGTPSGANIGTQREMEARLGMPSQPDDSNYAVVDRQNLDPVFRFRAVDRDQANRIYGLWLAAAGLPQTTEDYGFQEIRPRSGQDATEIERDWRIVNRETGETLNTISGASRDQAQAVLQDTARRNGVRADMLSLQPAPALDDIPEVPVDVAQNFPQDRTDGRNVDYSFRDLFGTNPTTDQQQGGIVDIAPDVAQNFPQASDNVYGATGRASSAPAGNSFSGQWRVMLDGEEVWRFRGVGNNQADANRIAQTWLQDQRSQGLLSPGDNAEIEVVPVMIEGLNEYKNTPLQDYNGLQFVIDTNHPYLRVKAFAPESGQQLAQVDFKIDDQDELHPEDLHVEERWRGQGIAKVMYDYVKSQGYTIHRSWSQTDAGSEFWDKHRGQKRVWEQGMTEGVYRGDWVRHPENPWQVGQIQSIDNGQAVVTWKKTDKRKKAVSSTHAVDALQHARREFSQLTQPTHTPGMAEDNALTEIEHMKQSHFTGGKDMLDSFKKPGKKHLKPLPGGTDLLYSITKDTYGSYVYIVDPGVPGITKQSIVASLSLVDVTQVGLPNSVQVGTITVDEDYRGRGLARALYGIVLTIMRKTLISGSSQTPGGRRNWLSLATIPGVEVQGLVSLSNRDTDTTIGDPKSRYNKYVEKTIDRVMELGGQFISRNKNFNYWAFDVEPGNGQLQPVVRNALSKLYGYDSDALLMAKWTGA